MALDQSALTELLDALRSGGDMDFMREAMQLVLQALIDLEATERIGAGRYERSDNRTTHRNGSRARLLSTKAGDVELAIPKLRHGSFFPALLEPRRRIDRALWAVIMEAFVHGVSTRKVDDLVAALGIDAGVSRSQVSRICAELDAAVAEFRERRLDHVGFPCVFLDATYVKAHDGASVVSKAIVVATGVSADGNREVLGLAVGDSEDRSFWTTFLRSLRSRGLAGVRLVISDAHQGLRASIDAVMLGAAWQRCRVLHEECPVPGTQGLPGDGGRRHPHRLRPARRRRGGRPARLHRRQAGPPVPAAEAMLREAAVDICAFAAFPTALEEGVDHQSVGTGEQGDQAPDQRGGHLPQRSGGAATGGIDPARGPRRVAGDRTPLPLRGLDGEALRERQRWSRHEGGGNQDQGAARRLTSSRIDAEDHAGALISHHSKGHGPAGLHPRNENAAMH